MTKSVSKTITQCLIMGLKSSFTIILLLLTGCSQHHKLYQQNPGFYAYIIGDVNSQRIYQEHAAEVYAIPASCQKVITSLVALKHLGQEYTYETKLLGKKNQQTITDIVLRFSGDPTLTSQQLSALLKPLQNSNIKGKIIIDVSIFKTPSYSNNLMVHDLGTKYAQPVWAANIDKNLLTMRCLPGKLGKPAKIEIDNNYSYAAKVLTSSDPTAIRLFWRNNRIHIEGTINYC